MTQAHPKRRDALRLLAGEVLLLVPVAALLLVAMWAGMALLFAVAG